MWVLLLSGCLFAVEQKVFLGRKVANLNSSSDSSGNSARPRAAGLGAWGRVGGEPKHQTGAAGAGPVARRTVTPVCIQERPRWALPFVSQVIVLKQGVRGASAWGNEKQGLSPDVCLFRN